MKNLILSGTALIFAVLGLETSQVHAGGDFDSLRNYNCELGFTSYDQSSGNTSQLFVKMALFNGDNGYYAGESEGMRAFVKFDESDLLSPRPTAHQYRYRKLDMFFENKANLDDRSGASVRVSKKGEYATVSRRIKGVPQDLSPIYIRCTRITR